MLVSCLWFVAFVCCVCLLVVWFVLVILYWFVCFCLSILVLLIVYFEFDFVICFTCCLCYMVLFGFVAGILVALLWNFSFLFGLGALGVFDHILLVCFWLFALGYGLWWLLVGC